MVELPIHRYVCNRLLLSRSCGDDSLPLGLSVQLLADPANFDVDQLAVTLDNLDFNITSDKLNKTKNNEGLFVFFSELTVGPGLHTVTVRKSYLAESGSWNLVAITYVMPWLRLVASNLA